ncbi:MAG: hypothetical protein CME38_00115 [Haliea sp.]|nr:hypothetical protein [Haliea sp.]
MVIALLGILTGHGLMQLIILLRGLVMLYMEVMGVTEFQQVVLEVPGLVVMIHILIELILMVITLI